MKDEPTSESSPHSANASRSARRRVKIPLYLGSILSLFGLSLFLIDSDVLTFFVPMRRVILVLVGAGTVLLAIARWQNTTSGGEKKRVFPSLARVIPFVGTVFLGATIGVYIHEYQAYQEVELEFDSEGVALAGTLYLPEGDGPHAAIVIAQGSLRAPRQVYHLFADNLVRRGFAVYAFDKRGTGKSGGDYQADNNASRENLALLGSDVAAAHVAVRRHPDVDAARVGLMGISMGGWLSPIAATRTDSVDYMVIVAGPPVSVGEEGYYSDLTGDGHGDDAGLDQAVIDSMVAFREPSGFDPRPILRTQRVPALWLFGEVDSSVPTAKSVSVLDTLVRDYDRPYAVHVFPGAEHLGFMMRLPFDLADDFWDVTTRFIFEQGRSPLAATTPARDERVTIQSGPWSLVGNLRTPELQSMSGDARLPAALLLNQAAGDRSAYNELADRLAARGFASLRLDLRGHGESINGGRFVPGNVPRSPMIWDAEQDVAAALQFLRADERIDAKRIAVVGASYSGEEMAEAGRQDGFAAAYVALSPGSFSNASIDGMDASGVPWLFVAADEERFLQEITADVRARSRTADVMIVPGGGHAADLLSAHPALSARIADWLTQHLR